VGLPLGTRLRHATLADVTAIATLHVAVWRTTYAGLAPPEVAAPLDVGRRIERWTTVLSEAGPRHVTLLAVDEAGRLLGFCHGGPPGDAIFADRAEVKWLYVDQAHAGRGIGTALLATSAARLRACGFAGVGLSVVVGNSPAYRFYEGLGGVVVGRFTDPGPVWKSTNDVFAWDDLGPLTARAVSVAA